MADMHEVPNPPSISRNEFNCPHCGAHSNQSWFTLAAEFIDRGETPHLPDEEDISSIKADRTMKSEKKEGLILWAEKVANGLVFLERAENGHYLHDTVYNLHLSKCFTCKKIAVWVHDTLLYPQRLYTIAPNQDMPDDVKKDYEEANEILDKSPRGAAALLRLAIQKLCVHLGEPGKNINIDIASLVKRGLDIRVQQALDVVRVVGNNAVHPGQMDIKDDGNTARTLFGLINLITEKLISEPKHIQNLFDSLPEGARKQIEERDK